jgi:hypothetical protein
MRALMSSPSLHASLLVLLGCLAGIGGLGCGKEIGDACFSAADCSPNGDRQCDTASSEGYCTVQGCDVDTCPEEAVCVRFFTGSFANKPCDPATEDKAVEGRTDACSLDELCALVGSCVPRSAEIRFCMRKCESDGDCRDSYECRGLEEMKAHGGEPVLEAGSVIDSNAPSFCAGASG